MAAAFSGDGTGLRRQPLKWLFRPSRGVQAAPRFVLAAVHNHDNLMRDIFTEIFENVAADPTEAARRGAKPRLRKRFYEHGAIGGRGEAGFPVLLDGKPVYTPARRLLAAPTMSLAQEIAAEWNAQKDEIDPARMPLTRLANAVIDGVADAPAAVAEDVAKYLGSDLVCYRAESPEGLVARQSEHWDPVLAWARDTLGAHFIQVQGVTFAAQPAAALAAARACLPADPWQLGALSSITALTGSALLALALRGGALDVAAAWAAAHVDEDWQMAQWGRDAIALAARDSRFAEMQAAATVLKSI
jgi:chaperone required for assembly of F1-ATPase